MIKEIPIFLPGDKVAWVAAGPTRELPDDRKLIRCAAEIPVPGDRIAFDVGTEDFTPFDEDTIIEQLPDIVDALVAGERLYVGCMGGIGRTGTMLAILVAQHPGMSGKEAIRYIRQVYKGSAVETADQMGQVLRLSHIVTIPTFDLIWAEPPTEIDPPRSRGWFASLWDRLTGG